MANFQPTSRFMESALLSIARELFGACPSNYKWTELRSRISTVATSVHHPRAGLDVGWQASNTPGVSGQRLPGLCALACGGRCSLSWRRRDSGCLARSWAEHPIGGALDPARPSVQDVGVDHRGAHVAVAEELLDGADVVTILEEVRGKRMAQLVRILLMNRLVFGFVTVTIPSSPARSISFVHCAGLTMTSW